MGMHTTPKRNNLTDQQRWDLVLGVKGQIWENILRVVKSYPSEKQGQLADQAFDCCLDSVFRGAGYYDPTKSRFTTYAATWIMAGITVFKRQIYKDSHFVTNWIMTEDSMACHDKPYCDDPDWNTLISEISDERKRQIVTMKFVDGLNYEQIGAKLGVTRQRVEQLYRKSVGRLKEKYGVV